MSADAKDDLRQKIGDICGDWWRELAAIDPKTGEEKEQGKPNRAALAELRRIGVVATEDGEHIEVAPAFGIHANRKLHGKLQSFLRNSGKHWAVGFSERDEFHEAVAVVASTLARVRKDTRGKGTTTAHWLGRAKDGEPIRDDDTARLMAEARFKHLIRTHDWPGLLDQGRRIVALLGRDVPVGDLGASLLLWNASQRTIRDWSFDYYGVAFAGRDPDDAVEDTPAATNTQPPTI